MAAKRASEGFDRPELRKHFRIPSMVPVDYQLLGPGGEKLDPEIRTAFTRDLSEGGLRLELTTVPSWISTRLASNEPLGLEVDIALPKKRLRLVGQIVWRSGGTDGTVSWLVGVKFNAVKPEDAAAIMDYARWAARRPLIVKSVVAGLALALVLGGFVYSWQTGLLKQRVESTTKALQQSEHQVAAVSDKLGDSQVDLTWIAVEVRELADTLDERMGRVPPKQPAGLTPMDQLRRSIERLRAGVLQLPQAKGNP